MSDYLVRHALTNVWCAPDQDLQSIISPRRISAPAGVWKIVDVMWRQYRLPDATNHYHVFAVGNLFPDLVGVLKYSNTWRTMGEAMNDSNIVVAVYSSNGIRFPAFLTYYRFTEDGMLIIAVPRIGRIKANFGTENLYLRFYTNTFFNSTRADTSRQFIKNEGMIIKTSADIISIGNKFNSYAVNNYPGIAFGFINGVGINRLNVATISIGDVVEYYYDGSVRQVVDFNYSDLTPYLSELDSKRKYLLHPPKNLLDSNLIQYLDDIDIYIVKKNGTNWNSYYYHGNPDDGVRMITYRDYGVPSEYIDAIADSNGWIDHSQLTIRLVLKHSGFHRPLVYDNNRIHELYKLPDTDIVDALARNPIVPLWHASNLEKSASVKVMGNRANQVTLPLVTEAYGYNSITGLAANNPRKTTGTSGNKVVSRLDGYTEPSVAIEYDASGLMTGIYNIGTGQIYHCVGASTDMVELVFGILSDKAADNTSRVHVIDNICTYRHYKKEPDSEWVEATKDVDYVIQNGTITWNVLDEVEIINRTDKSVYRRHLSIDPTTRAFDNIRLDYQLGPTRVDTPIPLGRILVFMNGRRLVEGLDYFMEFPRIVICNKQYMTGTLQEIDIVAWGHSDRQMKHYSNDDIGFVKNGRLSDNAVYDVRDDRVVSVSIDGVLYLKSEIEWKEDGSFINDKHVNGKPYQVQSIVTSVKEFIDPNKDSYDMITESQAINQVVSNYLTVKYPVPETPLFSIPQRHLLYSPFFNRILFDWLNNFITDPRIKDSPSDDFVREIGSNYADLLRLDPCHDNNLPDSNYVYVQPHVLNTTVDVDAYLYRFMTNINRIYLKNRLNLSGFLRIVT